MTAKQRELRMVRLTLDEVSAIPSNTSVYEGIGRMYVDHGLSRAAKAVRSNSAADTPGNVS